MGAVVAEHSLRLRILPERYAVWQLPSDASLPPDPGDGLFSVTRTPDELSVLGRAEDAPEDVRCETGWRCLVVSGPLDFELTGVLESLATPLAAAGVPIFALSTFATDYVLVREPDLSRAVVALDSAGHRIASDEAEPTLEVIRFIRHTLGCGCPPEVFARIDVHLQPAAFAGLAVDASIDIGGRLLVLVAGAAAHSGTSRTWTDLVSRGREIRDARGFNRLRLVIAASGSAAADEELHTRFQELAGDDDRLHLHVLGPKEVPCLELLARKEDAP